MKIIGHRGANGLAAENTIVGLVKAVKTGVDEIEIDVRVTSDSIPVLFHDSRIAIGNERKPINKLAYDDLKKSKANLATLEEAILRIGKQVPIVLDVKAGVAVEPITKVISKYTVESFGSKGISIGSFSQKTLLEFNRLAPKVPMLVIENWSGVRATLRARQLNTKLVSMNQRFLWFGFIRSMNKRGYQLYAFTLNSPKKAARWKRHGLAAVITDYPNRFKK
jgi:glycerophosphoryl diester phosphodiesterase